MSLTSSETSAPTAAASEASEAGLATGSAAPLAPPNPDTLTVSKTDAKLAGVGFSVGGLGNGGWTHIQSPDTLLRLSGPPGGPLGFEVRVYDETSKAKSLQHTFETLLLSKPLAAGPAEKFEFAGSLRDAQSFRRGEGFAQTSWCLIRIPAAENAKTGLLVVAYASDRKDGTPSCARAFAAPALEPIAKTFALVH